MPKWFFKITGPSNVWEAGEYSQAWHKRRHLALLSLLSPEEKGKIGSVLEVGCGVGFAAKCYKDAKFLEGRKYLGTDTDETALETARKKMPALKFVNSDITRRELEGKFDLIIADSVFEHLENPGEAIKNMRGLTDGFLLLSVPHMESHSSKYALAGYHRTTGIGEKMLEEFLRPLFVPVAFQRYPIPELERESGIGMLLFAKAAAV